MAGDMASIRMVRDAAYQIGALNNTGGAILVSEDVAEQLSTVEFDELTANGATVLVDPELEPDSLEAAAEDPVGGLRVLARPGDDGGDGRE